MGVFAPGAGGETHFDSRLSRRRGERLYRASVLVITKLSNVDRVAGRKVRSTATERGEECVKVSEEGADGSRLV